MNLIPGSGISPGGESGNPVQYSCLKNSRDRGARKATVKKFTKSRTRRSNQAQFKAFYGASLVAQRVKRLPAIRETRVRSLGREDRLEKEMTTHSSTLAWKIPWTEKPGRLQSMGSQRVRHDWARSFTHLGSSYRIGVEEKRIMCE